MERTSVNAITKTLNYKNHKAYWNDLSCVVGCVACRILGRFNDHVSIHHIDGRTKPMAHWNVLPLCSAHHQHGTEDSPSVHPWKRRFEAMYGSQSHLREYCNEILVRMREAH